MNKPDVIRVSFQQNPALAEVLGPENVGYKGKAELHFMVKSKDEEGADLVVEAVVPEGYEVGEDTEGAAMSPAEDEPMSPTSMMVRRMRAKS